MHVKMEIIQVIHVGHVLGSILVISLGIGGEAVAEFTQAALFHLKETRTFFLRPVFLL